jgi:hypothetical protein
MKEASRVLKPGGILFLFSILISTPCTTARLPSLHRVLLGKGLDRRPFRNLELNPLRVWYLIGLYLAIYLQSFDRGILKVYSSLER